jgi:hypothetical protein
VCRGERNRSSSGARSGRCRARVALDTLHACGVENEYKRSKVDEQIDKFGQFIWDILKEMIQNKRHASNTWF